MTDTLNQLAGAIPAARFIANAATAAILALIVLVATIIDMTDALITARRLMQPIRSHSLRKTVAKVTEYWRVLLAGFLADSVCCFTEYYDQPYATIVIALGLVVIEIKSLMEHARERKSALKELPEALGDALRIAARMRGAGAGERLSQAIKEQIAESDRNDQKDRNDWNDQNDRTPKVNRREEH